jgi:DNA repair exonuclease SbcCD ATPase subunit
MNLKEIRSKLDRLKGAKEETEKQILDSNLSLKELGKDLNWHEKAREIVREVGLKTQQQLQYHISDITSLALESIFDEPYELKVEFVERRNKTECDLLFVRNGERIDPISASGGGAVDVAAFALRIASWSMKRPRTRPVIVMDEPLRFLSEDLQEKASLMIKELSKKLKLQFVIITHEPTLATYADKEFRVTIKNGISNVKEL